MYMCIRTNAAQRSEVGFLRRDFRASWTTSTGATRKNKKNEGKGADGQPTESDVVIFVYIIEGRGN
jgi:hypothetical protein